METQVIYTCPGKGQANRKTNVHIDWSTISRDQLIVLARARILSRLQKDFVRNKEYPDHCSFSATQFVAADHEYVETGTSGKDERASGKQLSQFELILAVLSFEEKKILLGQL